MEITASQSYIRCGQQKLRDVARAVRGLPVPKLRMQLRMMNREAAKRILETVNQAVANAQHNFGINEEQLTVKELLVLRGPHYKRFRAVSRGQGHAILKRTSHIRVTLVTSEEAKKPETKKEQPEVKAEAVKTETKVKEKKAEKKAVTKKPTVKKTAEAKVSTKKTE